MNFLGKSLYIFTKSGIWHLIRDHIYWRLDQILQDDKYATGTLWLMKWLVDLNINALVKLTTGAAKVLGILLQDLTAEKCNFFLSSGSGAMKRARTCPGKCRTTFDRNQERFRP